MIPDQLNKFLGLSQTESGSRSTVLKPLMWFLGITFSGTIGCFRFGAPMAVGVTFAALTVLGALVFLGIYMYFAITDKDALRSESFSIKKLAIQSRLVGDDTSWANTLESPYRSLPASSASALPSSGISIPQDPKDTEPKQ